MFEYALVAGLMRAVQDVYLLHVTTTPRSPMSLEQKASIIGIMISASHNPYYDNGIKVINGSGYKLEAEVEDLIEAYIDSEEDTIPLATKEKIGRTVDYNRKKPLHRLFNFISYQIL